MGKPSIFSKEYERRKKQRRKRIAFLVLLIVIASFSLLYWSPVSKFFTESQLYKELQAKYKDNQNTTITENNENKSSLSSNKDKDKEKENEKKVEEKYFEIKLPDGTNARAVYEQSDSIIKFKFLTGNDKASFDISPSGRKMIILDGTTQDMLELSVDNSVKDLTYKFYTTKNKSKIYKDKTLSKNPQFIWHGTPKYISEDNIAYISLMPWFKTDKYIWMVDSKTNAHSYIKNISGKEIIFGNINDKGLEVTVDGAKKTISPDGKVL